MHILFILNQMVQMNITNFNNILHGIKRGIDLTHFHLEYDRTLPNQVRIQFNEALDHLLQLITDDNEYKKLVEPVWHIAHRIVEFHRLYSRIETVRRNILRHSSKPFFVNKIRYWVLPPLDDRIQQMRVFIGSMDRLPFVVGGDRGAFHEEVKGELQVRDVKQLDYVEREYFHLVGQHLDAEKLQKINCEAYSGSMEIYSLESWKAIINRFISEGDNHDKRVGVLLLSMIERAIPLALKTSFAFYLPQVTDGSPNEQEEITYFSDLVEANRQNTPGSSSRFLNKYRLAKDCSLPAAILINEMAWDILATIFNLQEGESALFLLGIRTHVIAVQVMREKMNNQARTKTYNYKIFNTGTAVSIYHELTWNEEYARPLIYHHIPEHLFSYDFAAGLLHMFCYEKNVEAFYKFHARIFLKEVQVRKDMTSGSLYRLQDFGICSYWALETWIESFLTSEQSKKLELIKLCVSTKKQEQVVKMLQLESRQTAEKRVGNRKEEEVSNRPILLTKSQKLEESQLLLELGRETLLQLTSANN
jgi:hypothetical protein